MAAIFNEFSYQKECEAAMRGVTFGEIKRQEPEEVVIDLCGVALSDYSLQLALSKARASDAQTVNITIKRASTEWIPQFVAVDQLLSAVVEQVQKGMTSNCPDCRKPKK